MDFLQSLEYRFPLSNKYSTINKQNLASNAWNKSFTQLVRRSRRTNKIINYLVNLANKPCFLELVLAVKAYLV